MEDRKEQMASKEFSIVTNISKKTEYPATE